MDCVFERVENIDSLSPDDFLDRFERYGFLWFRAKGSKSSAEKMPTGNQILDFVNDHASACEASWTIENYSKGAPLKEKITPQNLSGFTGTNTSFYASTIVHRKPDSSLSPAYQKLSQLLPKYETVFEDIHDNGDPSGTWLFFGHHGKKRKRVDDRVGNNEEATSSTLHGRAEHVDEVTHSGTYHFQVSGTKTWKIRPHPDSLLAEELKQQESGGRIKITVEEGDIFVLNTKIWYHCTELNFMPSSSSEWSISVAQDFYLPVPCPKDVKQGDVVYGYDYNHELVDVNNDIREGQEIHEELARSDDPNCVLVEVDVDGDHESVDMLHNVNDNDHKSIQTKVALVALRDITEGENLTIAFDPEGEQLGNANEQIDPRVIARQNWNKNEIVIQGEDRMPQDIPRSYEPNCVLVEVDNGVLALRALEDIPEGAVYCVMPDEDEDYDEVEVEFGTGELVQQA